MIETIFYFANSKTEYDANANSGNISARTISFVPTGNGVGDIYKNGIKYGSSIDEDELIRIINEKITDADFNIPFASTTKAGIIKLGKGLKSVGNDGTVDVDFTGLDGTDGLDGLDGLIESILKTIIDKNGTGVVVTPRSLSGSTVAIADIKVGNITKTIYAPAGSNNQNDPINTDGGLNYAITDFSSNGTLLTISQNNNTNKSVDIKDAVKQSIQNFIDNGDTIINNFGQKTSVSVVPLFNSSTGTTKIATITVDGTSKELWIPAGTGGGDNPGGGTTYVENPYDDSDIKDAIDDLLDTSRSESERLDNLINTLDNEIQDKVEDMFNDVEWIQNNWPEGQTTGDSNFGEDDVESYLQRLGFWTTDGNGNTVTQWSKIQQDVDSINLAVNALSSDGEITEALQASIDQAVENGVAKLNLSTTYAKADDTKKVIEWLTSGFRSKTSGEMTYNEILSAANNGNHSGISDLYSRVTEIEGSYVAEAGLNAKVDDAIAGIKASTDGTYSATRLFNQIDTNTYNISGMRSYIDENGASATLLAQLDDKYAGIDVAVKKGPNGVIESGVTLNADKINISAGHDLNLQSGFVHLEADKIDMSGLITAINGDESSVVIDADKIEVGGIKIEDLNISGINDLIANSATISSIQSDLANVGNLTVKKLEAGSSNKIYVNSDDGVYVHGTCNSQINPDGSGYLGSNGNSSAITWNTDGSGSIANGNISWNNRGSVSSFDLKGDGYTVISVTNTQTDGVSEMLGGLIQVYGDGVIGRSKLRGDGLSVETSQTSYDYTASGPVQYSDMRKKDVIEDENISIESIASAPLFKYRPKGFDSAQIQIGSSAQYWQDLVPEAVSSDEEGYLKMNYMTLNTVASLTSAKEIVKLKEENTALTQRVEALEARLQLIENKLNA